MPTIIPSDSVGLITPKILHIDTPINLEGGHYLAHYDLIYETYGQLNSDRSNAVLICCTTPPKKNIKRSTQNRPPRKKHFIIPNIVGVRRNSFCMA